MPLVKGDPKTIEIARKGGIAKRDRTRMLEKTIMYLLGGDSFEGMNDDIEKLSPKDRVSVKLQLIEYVLPKLSRKEVVKSDNRQSAFTIEQAKKILESIVDDREIIEAEIVEDKDNNSESDNKE